MRFNSQGWEVRCTNPIPQAGQDTIHESKLCVGCIKNLVDTIEKGFESLVDSICTEFQQLCAISSTFGGALSQITGMGGLLNVQVDLPLPFGNFSQQEVEGFRTKLTELMVQGIEVNKSSLNHLYAHGSRKINLKELHAEIKHDSFETLEKMQEHVAEGVNLLFKKKEPKSMGKDRETENIPAQISSVRLDFENKLDSMSAMCIAEQKKDFNKLINGLKEEIMALDDSGCGNSASQPARS